MSSKPETPGVFVEKLRDDPIAFGARPDSEQGGEPPC